MTTRRCDRFLALVALGCALALRSAFGEPTNLPLPDPATLLFGDLLWPKRPMAIVPYDSSVETSKQSLKSQWERERDAFVKTARKAPDASQDLLQLATDFEAISYEEFYLQYNAGLTRMDIERFGAIDDVLTVGHVAIVDIDADGKKWVIEAVLGNAKKVQRVPYDKWIEGRAGSWVWVGRLNHVSKVDLEKFVGRARSYVGKPYSFWNFDLGDESSFYCSKLLWLSLSKATDISLDDDKNQKRAFWFSPKQAWNSRHIIRVNSPGDQTY